MSSNRTLYGTISATAPYGDSITQLNVKFTPEQSSTPSLMPETNSVYLSRPTEGTGELMELVGGSVAWNQLAQVRSSYSIAGVTLTVDGNSEILSGTATQVSAVEVSLINLPLIAGHKYYVTCMAELPTNTYLSVSGVRLTGRSEGVLTYNQSYPALVMRIDMQTGAVFNNLKVTPQYTDLTQMFGSTIADYVYSLEQATAGSGIAWLQSYDFFTEDYYAYSAPTLQSVEATAHVTVGFNQWDEEYIGGYYSNTGSLATRTDQLCTKNKIRVIPNTAYYFKLASLSGNQGHAVVFYDANGNFISRQLNVFNFTTPPNCEYINANFGTNYGATYHNDICINISNPSLNDTYKPYTKTTTPLANITLRGILMKDADGNLYYDGDTYEWDGTVTRRYGVVTFDGSSEEDWKKSASYEGNYYWSLSVPNGKNQTTNAINTYTPNIAANTSDLANYNRCIYIEGGAAAKTINIKNPDIASAADFKTWIASNPITVVYELATQTTESADPFTAVQTVEDGGTEEFTTSNGVPVGVIGRFANAVPMEGVDSFTVTANDGTSHTYPVTLSEEIYRGYVDMLTGEAVSDMASIAEYNGETISEPWLSSLDVYSVGATPTNGAQVVYPITPEEVTATITGDPTELGEVTSVTSTKGTVKWGNMMPLGLKAEITIDSPF